MPLKTTVLFESPRHEIATLIGEKLVSSIHTRILTGFATPTGVEALIEPLLVSLKHNGDAIHTLVIGLGTHGAYAALDRLIKHGFRRDRMFVHLGRSKNAGTPDKPDFAHYHPMLHSKIYYMEQADGNASAFIGSHNLTGFAMHGNNGEAAVLLEGERGLPEFEQIRRHIDAAQAESQVYNSERKVEYAWWTLDFLSGVAKMANDAPVDGEVRSTIIILCEQKQNLLPSENHRLYFELPVTLRQHEIFRADVHVYIFDRLPASPGEALACATRGQTIASRWCRIEGLQRNRGGVELAAQWSVTNDYHPVLEQVDKSLRPEAAPKMQQIQAKVFNEVRGSFEYFFKEPASGWKPVFEGEQTPADFRSSGNSSETWRLVQDLDPAEPDQTTIEYHEVLRQLNPKAGSYILLSQQRRQHNKITNLR